MTSPMSSHNQCNTYYKKLSALANSSWPALGLLNISSVYAIYILGIPAILSLVLIFVSFPFFIHLFTSLEIVLKATKYYSRTSIIRTPKGKSEVSVLERCPYKRAHYDDVTL